MTTTRVELRSAVETELDEIQHLLQGAQLPFSDLTASNMTDFVVARDRDGKLLGAGGMERYEDAGLLRSVAVDESARGSGLGKAICNAIEERAQKNGVNALYLLTTTAATFFPRLGYETFDRDMVPESVLRSTEFANLCPASATCLYKDLSRSSAIRDGKY